MPGIKAPADKTQVEVNGRPMDVALSSASPGEASGDAYLSFLIDAEVAKETNAFRSNNSADQFVGIIAGPDSEIPVEAQISHATFSALRLIGEDGAKSAVIPVSRLLTHRMGLSAIDLAASILHGVNLYANYVRNEARPDFVSDITVAGGVALFLDWMNVGPMISSIVKTPPEEKDGAIVLKSGTFDLSPRGLGSRAGIYDFSEETAISQEPDGIQRAWLEMIGEDLVNFTNSRGFHRNSPLAPRADNERKLIVTFDAGTGLPVSLQSGDRLPPPEQLAYGEAAILVEYFEAGGRGNLSVGRQMVVSERPADPEVLRSIVGISQFSPILPSANVDVLDLGDGSQLLTPDSDVDKLNAEFVKNVLNPNKPQPMTMMGAAFIMPGALKALSEYWSARTEKFSYDDIYTYLSWRSMGHEQYDFYIDENGRFVGATMHQNAENSPRGTTYHVGATTVDNTGAKDVSFRFVKRDDGTIIKVPISYEWRGKKALAFDAFLRWFSSIEFVRARESIATKDMLSEIMFPGRPPEERAAIFVDYLEKNPEEMDLVDMEFYNLNGLSMSSHRKKYGAYRLLKSLREFRLKGTRRVKGAEVEIAHLELLMRRVLGEKKIDGILAAGITPSFGPAGNVPLLPEGGGQDQGSQFMGIARVPVEEETEASQGNGFIPGASNADDITAIAQGAGSSIPASAIIAIGATTVAGK